MGSILVGLVNISLLGSIVIILIRILLVSVYDV